MNDIEILEEILNRQIEDTEGTKIMKQAIENLINRVKELEEENKYLKEQIPVDKIFYYSYKDYIPKSKIKEKIEELDRQRIEMEKDDIGVGFTLGKEWSDIKAQIQILRELLEEE